MMAGLQGVHGHTFRIVDFLVLVCRRVSVVQAHAAVVVGRLDFASEFDVIILVVR